MQRVAGEEVLGRRQQHDVALRDVGAEIEHPVWEHELREIWKPPYVRVGARKAEQVHSGSHRELLDGWRLRRSHQEDGVDLALLELLGGCVALDRQQLGSSL